MKDQKDDAVTRLDFVPMLLEQIAENNKLVSMLVASGPITLQMKSDARRLSSRTDALLKLIEILVNQEKINPEFYQKTITSDEW